MNMPYAIFDRHFTKCPQIQWHDRRDNSIIPHRSFSLSCPSMADSVLIVCLGYLQTNYLWLQVHGVHLSAFSLIPLISLDVSTFALDFGPICGVMSGEPFSPKFKGIVCVVSSLIEFCFVKSYQTSLKHYTTIYCTTFGKFGGAECWVTFMCGFLCQRQSIRLCRKSRRSLVAIRNERPTSPAKHVSDINK